MSEHDQTSPGDDQPPRGQAAPRDAQEERDALLGNLPEQRLAEVHQHWLEAGGVGPGSSEEASDDFLGALRKGADKVALVASEAAGLAPLMDKAAVATDFAQGADTFVGTPDSLAGKSEPVADARPDSMSGSTSPALSVGVESVELQPVSRGEGRTPENPSSPTQRDQNLATPTERELEAGLVLGAYKLVKKLGQGGMGMVFLAEHRRMERLVALKVLPPSVTRNYSAVERFHREVKAMARLSHPNIVTAFDADEARGLHILVMEYVDGQDLSVLVKKRGPLPVEQAVDYIVQGAKGLEYAHKRGLVHRDIKPSNFLVDTEGQVKILDLGLARFSEQTDDGDGPPGMDLTGTGVVVGTVDYMSPEQAEDTKRADARADIYSLGCSLFFLLSGRSMFGGDTVVARLMAHQNQPVPSLKSINPAVPEELERIHRKMVAKKKDERYQTATALLDDLRKLAPEAFAGQGPRFAPDAARPANNDQTLVGPLSGSVTGGSTAFGSSAPATASLSTAAGAVRPPVNKKLLVGAAAAALALLFGVWIVIKDKDGKEIARIPVEPGKSVTVQPAPGTGVTVENTGEGAGTGATPPASGGWHGWPADAPKPAIAPFDAAQAKKHQEEWAAYLKVPVEYTNSVGMKFALLPPGEFLMGSTADQIEAALKDTFQNDEGSKECIRSEAPQRRVILTQPIYLGVNEVSQGEYQQVMGVNPAHFSATGEGKPLVAGLATTRFPVETVSWNDAADFCSRLSQREKRQPCYAVSGETVTPLDGTGYRLPSEAEWEFACRAGTTTWYWSGDTAEDLKIAGWFDGNSGGRLHATGELRANPFGFHDMHGNLREWVQDGWDPNWYHKFQGQAAINPNISYADKHGRMVRGGNWFTPATLCRSSLRYAYAPMFRFKDFGFRVAIPVDAVKASLAERAPKTAGSATSGAGWHGWPADAPKPAIAPFDAAQAKKHQEEWAAYLKVPVEYTNSIGMKFRLIPPGEFTMGSTPEEIEAAVKELRDLQFNDIQDRFRSEAPRHRVVLTKPFYLAAHETTQAAYEKLMGKNPSHFSRTSWGKEQVAGADTSQWPVENVMWDEASAFLEKLAEVERTATGRMPSVVPSDEPAYRLPRESEWEFAARAGTTTQYWTGNALESLTSGAWFQWNSKEKTHPVGRLSPNAFGLFDMAGNVWEWTNDGWERDGYSKFVDQPAIDPVGSPLSDAHKVFRGGCWSHDGVVCRSAARHAIASYGRNHYTGFRVAASLEEARLSLAARKNNPAVSEQSWHAWPADAPKPAIAPFDAAQAKQHQEEWAAYLKVPVEYTNSIGMKFRLIPPGEFTMGSTAEEIAASLKVSLDDQQWKECIQSEAPKHRVVLTQPTYMGVNEVTQSEYEKVMGANPSEFAPMGTKKSAVTGIETARHPVETVTWNDAAEFCAKLSKQESLNPFYFRAGETVTPLDGRGYRLPSEAEWEFACRAGTMTKYWIGDHDESVVRGGWFGLNAGDRTHAVGELAANPFGLFDVHGNVWEWVQDGWDATHYGQFREQPAINPGSPFHVGTQRVMRGGGWFAPVSLCRSSSRLANDPRGGYHYAGFRVSLTVDAVKGALAERTKSSATAGAGWHGWPADAPKPAIAPFDAAQAKAHQEAWAKYLKIPVQFRDEFGIDFELIPPGEFTMGLESKYYDQTLAKLDPKEEPHLILFLKTESPAQRVTLTRPFYLAKKEFSNAQFTSYVEQSGAVTDAERDGFGGITGPVDQLQKTAQGSSWRTMKNARDRAVGYLTVHDAERVVEHLSKKHGLDYRLPTEAEWEYACRAGTTTLYSFGETATADQAACDRKAANVGAFPANAFGLHDMHGGASEWTGDDWERPAEVALLNVDPVRPQKSPYRVARGGAYILKAISVRSSMREPFVPQGRGHTTGFRLALPFESLQKKLGSSVKSAGSSSATVLPTLARPFDDWLRGRNVLTVAQDGSGQFNTIQAALDKVRPGEVVKVLDKGPYRERLTVEGRRDVGLISEEGTILELSDWVQQDVLVGHVFSHVDGFRLHGLRIHFPNDEGRMGLRVGNSPGFVLEHCHISCVTQNPMKQKLDHAVKFEATGLQRSVAPITIRECRIDVNLGISFASDEARAVIEHNHFTGAFDGSHLSLSASQGQAIAVRHNVFDDDAVHGDINIGNLSGPRSLEIVNNLLSSREPISFHGPFDLKSVVIRNNVQSRTYLAYLVSGAEKSLDAVTRDWSFDHNAYTEATTNIDWDVPKADLPKGKGDILGAVRFLSSSKNDPNYLRLVPDDPRSTSGAGEAWPTYMGPLPPGPAPREGDWFNRLRERWGELKGKGASAATSWQGWPADAPAPALVPFDAAQAKAHQEAWATYLKVPAEYTNSLGMKFRLIPPGKFVMGSSPEEIEATIAIIEGDEKAWKDRVRSEGARHPVTITRPYYLAVTEVTQGEYEKIIGKNPSHFSAKGAGRKIVKDADTSRQPVETINWHEALAFCKKLAEADKLSPASPPPGEPTGRKWDGPYSLPTEAEWEFAARGGTATTHWTGPDLAQLGRTAWYIDHGEFNPFRTYPVGQLEANPLGLCDMYGNVWEWTLDGYEQNHFQKLVGGVVDPTGPNPPGNQRVQRGGAGGLHAMHCRSSNRGAVPAEMKVNGWGFRVALSVDAVREKQRQANVTTALGFDGAGARVEIPELKWDPSKPLTVEAWCLPSKPVAQGLVAGFEGECELKLRGRHWWFGVKDAKLKKWQEVVATADASFKNPMHIAGVWNGTEVRLFYDGVRHGDPVPVTARPARGVIATLGAAADGSQPFAGRMLQVRVSTVARYVDDFDPAPVLESDGDTAALYRFDKETGETVPDLSGNNRTGTLRGAKWTSAPRVPGASVVTPAAAPKPAIAPFDAAEAERYQQEWAAYLKVPVEYTNRLGIKFRLIPPGEFQMGSTSDEIADGLRGIRADDAHWIGVVKGEAPRHRVILTRPFYLAATEVTQAQYKQVTGSNPSHFSAEGKGKQAVEGLDTSNHPVEWMTWDAAVEFCDALSKGEKLAPHATRPGEAELSPDATGYRLPTEAEWEFACRAGTTTRYWGGDSGKDLERAGWFDSNSGRRPHPVGELAANPFGLFDVHGNVWEWMADGWKPEFYGQFTSVPAIDPLAVAPSGTLRMIRGGVMYLPHAYCRSGSRHAFLSTVAHQNVGIRLALPVEGVRQLHAAAAPKLDGGDAWVEVPELKLNVGRPLTVEVLGVVSAASPNAMIAGFAGQVALRLRDRRFSFRSIQPDGTVVENVSDRDAEIGRRTHVAGVFDGRALRLYVDGQPQGEALPCGPTVVADVIASIGANPKGDDPLAGEIEAVRFSNGALYDAAFTPPGALDRRDDTLALFDFRRLEEGRIEDLSGHARSGTVLSSRNVTQEVRP